MGDNARNLTCELIGTFALTLIGAGAILTNTWTGGSPGLLGIAIAHGLALSIAVSAAMNISGGHINPSITVAMLVSGRIKAPAAIAYIVAQCVGAILAGVLLAMIFGGLGTGDAGLTGRQAIEACKHGTPNFGSVISPAMALLVEVLLTFLLAYAVMGTAVDPGAPKIGGFGIGLTVGMDILLGGPLTGAAMNPARTIGTLIGGGSATSSLWSQHWVYWGGPIIGAVAAVLLYDTLVLRKDRAGG